MKKNYIISFVIISLIILLSGCAKTQEEKSLKEVDSNLTIRLEGKIYPMDNQKVLAGSNGFIKKIYVQNGDVVKKGDLLYELDENLIQMKINKLENEIKHLNKTKELLMDEDKNSMALNLSAIELKKMAYLKSQNMVSSFQENSYKKAYITNLNKEKSDKSSFSSKIDLLNNSIQDKQYQLKTLKYSLKYSNGYASISGFITNLNITKNQQIVKNQLICNILNIEEVIIRAGLAPGLLPFVHKNQKVNIAFVTSPPYETTATITRVNPIIDKDFGMMTIDIKLKNHNYILQEGVRGLVTIKLPKKAQKKVKEMFEIKGKVMTIGSDI